MLFCRALGERGADFGCGRKEGRRLGVDDGEIFVFCGCRILGGGELHDFAFGNCCGGVRHDFQNRERSGLDQHAKGLAEQKIANQNARLVAPDHARRFAPAPCPAFIDHVVV